MKILLDTNVFIWASREPDLLSQNARTALEDPYNERFVSLATVWEMQIQHALGKLPLLNRAEQIAKAWMRPLAARELAIGLTHIGKLYDLPAAHRDPFDRLLIAQALSEDLAIVSPDAAFRLYPVTVIW